MQIDKIRYRSGDRKKITYTENGSTRSIKERDESWEPFIESYSTEIAEYDKKHRIAIKIEPFLRILMLLLLISFLLAFIISFIYDMNLTAVLAYPIYMFLDSLSGHFRYASQFLRITVSLGGILLVTMAITVGVTLLARDTKRRLFARIAYPIVAIAIGAFLVKYVPSSALNEFRSIYYEKEGSVVIQSDEIRHHNGRRSRNFRSDIQNTDDKTTTLEFTSYQYYNIRKANKEKKGQRIRVFYLDTHQYRKNVFAYEFVEE